MRPPSPIMKGEIVRFPEITVKVCKSAVAVNRAKLNPSKSVSSFTVETDAIFSDPLTMNAISGVVKLLLTESGTDKEQTISTLSPMQA